MRKFYLAVAAVLCMSVVANASCKKPSDSYEATYCSAKMFLALDDELNDIYKELRSLVSPDMQKKLKAVQLEWIEYRNGQCEYMGTINLTCNNEVTTNRIEYMRQRVREIKAGQARNDLIGVKSW